MVLSAAFSFFTIFVEFSQNRFQFFVLRNRAVVSIGGKNEYL